MSMDDLLLKKRIKEIYWERNPEGIKSDFGKTLLIGSSKSYPNAIIISALFSDITGVGYTFVSTEESCRRNVLSKVPLNQVSGRSLEERYSLTVEERKNYLSSFNSILFGNGIEIKEENRKLLFNILSAYQETLIIDASGLVLLKEILDSSRNTFAPKNILLTPHLGEARKLLDAEDIVSRNPLDYKDKASAFSKKRNRKLLLKSSSSLLVDGDRFYPSSYSPCAVLGKAGSGDGLAGYLAGLIGSHSKDGSLDDLIVFGDDFLHQAAIRVGKKISPALGSILDVLPERRLRIQEAE